MSSDALGFHFDGAGQETLSSTSRSRSALGDISNVTSSNAGHVRSRAALGDISNVTSGNVGQARVPSARGVVAGSICADASPTELTEVDKTDAEDPQCVVEYISDIYAHYRNEETKYQPQPGYMELQHDINEKMRAILVDWLVEVHLKYKLKPETLYLTVNLLDRFLQKKQISRKKLQLVGVTAMLIASKYEEIYAPEVRDFVYITDKAYTKQEILDMEILMLNTLQWLICVPTPAHFLDRFQRINMADEAHACLAHYLMELTLTEFKMVGCFLPSQLAAATTFLSNKLLRRHPSWPPVLIRHTRYTETLIKGCAKEMCALLETVESSSLMAVRKKYSQAKFHSVAKMQW